MFQVPNHSPVNLTVYPSPSPGELFVPLENCSSGVNLIKHLQDSVLYKCSYCFKTLKQWLHLQITSKFTRKFITLNSGIQEVLYMVLLKLT